MSALESPPTLAPLWQDPWAAAAGVTGAVMTADADFYAAQQRNVQNYYGQTQMNYHPGIVMENNNCSQSSNSSNNSNSTRKQVNFKLDIKTEMPDLPPSGMQKVPSISDLSDPESSLDIPCSQVSLDFEDFLKIGQKLKIFFDEISQKNHFRTDFSMPFSTF